MPESLKNTIMSRDSLLRLKELSMLRYRYILFILVSLFLLTGCSNREQQAIRALNEFEAESHDSISELDVIKKSEVNLQDDFEATIGEDESLETFSDEQGPIFDNLNKRQESIEILIQLNKSLDKARERLAAIESSQTKGVTKEDITSLMSSLDSFKKVKGKFTKDYQLMLDAERKFYSSLGDEDMDYKKFQAGLSDINKLADQNMKEVDALSTQLDGLSTVIRSVHDKLVVAE
ncbi:MAG TPA: hypothetical protein DIW15_04925 [Bavariicoccus seileri]|uniref:Cell-wall binding lipoprotein n=2 Tax=Bavariicoccus seileri TaxID=549685 RepID=A0A3D4S7U1_9ENTE|nr:hypothetical protein [Bavariicoccus seileri]